MTRLIGFATPLVARILTARVLQTFATSKRAALGCDSVRVSRLRFFAVTVGKPERYERRLSDV